MMNDEPQAILSKDKEAKLIAWSEKQVRLLEQNFNVKLVFTPTIEMSKTLAENRANIEEQLKEAILDAQGLTRDTTTKTVKVKSPFKNITVAEYKNIKKQLPDSINCSPTDLGVDATEEIAINYYRDNYGLSIKSLIATRITPKEQYQADEEKLRREYEAEREKARTAADELLAEKAKMILQSGDCTLLDKAERIHAYFQEQNLGCEHITLLSQFGLFGMGMKFLFEGSGGIGKSRASVEQMERFAKRFQDNRIKILSGHVSPLQMYEILHDHAHNKDVLVIDEGHFVVSNEQIQQMLKDALFRGKVYWQSKSKLADHLPDEFEWKGNIIINANHFTKRDNPNSAAFLDRLITFKIVLSNEEIIKKMMSDRTFTYDDALEEEMMNRITLIRSGQVTTVLTQADLDYLYGFVANEVKFLTTQYSQISFRTLQKCRTLYTAFKLYFGGVSEYTKEWYETIARNIVKGNTTENFIIQTLRRVGGTMKTGELRDLVMSHYNVGKTQAYDKIKQLKEAGMVDGTRDTILQAKANGG